MSSDKGASWQEIGGNLHRKFTETLRADRTKSGVLLAGGEEGIFRTDDAGAHWTIAGASGFASRREYTVVGPAVTLAHRLQAATFDLNAYIVAARETVEPVEDLYNLVPITGITASAAYLTRPSSTSRSITKSPARL